MGSGGERWDWRSGGGEWVERKEENYRGRERTEEEEEMTLWTRTQNSVARKNHN